MMKTKVMSAILALGTLIGTLPCAAQSDGVKVLYYYIDQNADKNGDGSLEHPFASLEKARNAMRLVKDKDSYDDVRIMLRGGKYEIDSTLQFGGQDSGSRKPPADDPGVIFKVDAPRVAMWKDAPYAWLFGYWGNDWSTYVLGIKDIQKNIVFTKSSPVFGISKGRSYYIFNLIEELDAPGEWYIDKDSEILYIYPKTEITEDTNVCFTVLESNMISIYGANNVRIEGITFENSKTDPVAISNSENCEVAGCTIRNISGGAGVVSNSKKCGFRSCDIYNICSRALSISGGDINTLEPCGNYVVNCEIHDWARVKKVYTFAIRVDGTGQYVVYNKLYSAPHLAI